LSMRSLMTAITVLGAMSTVWAPPIQAAGMSNHLNPGLSIVIPFGQNHAPAALEVAANGPSKICFWHDTSGGTAFGKSGSCPSVAFAVLGHPCTCNTPTGVQKGKIMLAPQGNGSLPVVR
jgi:hypothetical protein